MSQGYIVLSNPSDNVADHQRQHIQVAAKVKTYLLPLCFVNDYMRNGLFEKTLIEWSKSLCHRDKLFLDIGAHTGTYSISLADSCLEVHAFEPQRMTYYALCGSVALSSLNNVICHNIGLGSSEQSGEQVLNISSIDGGGSSLHNLRNQYASEKVQIQTLDSLNLQNIGFIKMDVEDNELMVLQGARETLRKSNYPAILFESNNDNPALFSFISNDLGYTIVNINNYKNMFLATIK